MQPTAGMEVAGPWNEMALRKVEEWDSAWAEACKKMSSNPWTNGVLSRKLIELICIGLNAACANLSVDGTRRHIRAALDAGATRDEILCVLKFATVMAVRSCAAGFTVVCKEASGPDIDRLCDAYRERLKQAEGTPAVEKLKAIGKWNTEWDALLILDPIWTEEFASTGLFIYTSGVLSGKDIELLRVALDSTFTHAPDSASIQRHIKNARKSGATLCEIMDVLKLCASYGVATCNLAVPVLAEEMAKQGK